ARAGAPVVSIGNLAVGGAGKTPAAIAVARRLAARGRTVAVLSRGYGAARADARVVSDGRAVLLDADAGGDEPVLLARRLPGTRVLCGPRRAELARTAVRDLGADALLLDDGFQHRALARDLDVVVLDAANPFGNGRLLPAGPNREPRSALRRAGLVWLSRVDQADAAALAPLRALAREATGREPIESRHAPVDVLDGALARAFGPDALRGLRVLLLAGIARPDGFRRTLAAMGASVALERVFPDHHRYGADDVAEALRAAADAGVDLVVTTEKDAVRLPPAVAADARLRAVRIDAEIVRGEDVLEASLDEALATATASTTTRRPAGYA
ncbi:MAG TPA: tetraacyldisaccharide 4'-kinase, partial [Anaeromyxobacter sp.]|nr:tetraacyldisaccharide 4'-kinase [Anaeromyxobacter sp.]